MLICNLSDCVPHHEIPEGNVVASGGEVSTVDVPMISVNTCPVGVTTSANVCGALIRPNEMVQYALMNLFTIPVWMGIGGG